MKRFGIHLALAGRDYGTEVPTALAEIRGTERCVTAGSERENLEREGLIPLHLADSLEKMIGGGRSVGGNDLCFQWDAGMELGLGR